VPTETIRQLQCSQREERIGLLGMFASPAVESAFGRQYFRGNLWLCRFLVAAGMLRVVVVLLADCKHIDFGSAFWLLFASRLMILLVSVWVLVVLRRVTCPAVLERLFFTWAALLVAMTVQSLSIRPPSNNGLLFMSFGVIIVGYCVAPLPLYRQGILTLSFSAAALYVGRHADGATLLMVGLAYAMSHVFGAVTSWRLNHRRRETFLGALREAELRSRLEKALAEVRTLQGMLHICAWCKRIRDEADVWEPLDKYVQRRTDASFSHGICPDCFRSQAGQLVGCAAEGACQGI
jgi:hypothetical protein